MGMVRSSLKERMVLATVSNEEVSELIPHSIFQDDLLERILAFLPIVSIVRARLVCKKWREITSSNRFLSNAWQAVSQTPWYIKFCNNPSGYAYDPLFQKWKGIDYLDMIEPFVPLDSSGGLVCFVQNKEIHVGNLITNEYKKLPEPLGLNLCGYSVFVSPCVSGHPVLVNICVNRRSRNYNVWVMRCEEVARSHGEFSFQVYDSATLKWTTSRPMILKGWTSGRKSVICDGVLYFLISSISPGHGRGSKEIGLLTYDFSTDSSSHETLINSLIPLPCSAICGLMNIKEKLIVVEAISRPEEEAENIGFSIWLLKGKEWQEISRITHTCFYNSIDVLFESSGSDDLIYIHSQYDPRIVVYDMNLKQWKCCQECPVEDMTNAFCFQPRLDISP